MAGKNKNKGLLVSSTFKAFVVVMLALLFIWVVLKINGSYNGDRKGDNKKVTVASNKELKEKETNKKDKEKVEITTTTETSTATDSTKISETSSQSITTTTEAVTETTTKKISTGEYENRGVSWSFKRNKDHTPVMGYDEGVDIRSFNAYYIGDTSKKVVYLTFDEGYENGYTSKILDILSANKVRATFFVTKAYVDAPNGYKYVARMKREGHYVGNHTATHPDTVKLTDEELINELQSTKEAMEEKSGFKMDMFYRPPMGRFSERTLHIADSLGYTTIFWSMAYRDWDTENQPGKEAAFNHVVENVHPGSIILLHAVSKSNTEALDDIIKELKAMGYSFKSLYDLPK